MTSKKGLFTLLSAATLAGFPCAEASPLTQADVERIVAQAATAAASSDPNAIIAVTDREGFILAIWDVKKRLQSPIPAFPPTDKFPIPAGALLGAGFKLDSLIAGAVTRASTASFLSSDHDAFTSRTAGYIIQQHFPVGVRDASNGPLVGVGLSSLFFSDVNRVKLIPPGFDGSIPLLNADGSLNLIASPGSRGSIFPAAGKSGGGINFLVPSSLSDSPGGVPLYKDGELVGGIGVTGDGSPTDLAPAGASVFKQGQRDYTNGFKGGHDTDEDVALAGQTGYRPPDSILATNVLIGGVRIPYVYEKASAIRDIENVREFGSIGRPVDIQLPVILALTPPGVKPAVTANDTKVLPTITVSGEPQTTPAPYPYEKLSLGDGPGEIRFPIRSDPVALIAGRQFINGKTQRLTGGEVTSILAKSAAQANITRGGIRLPLGTSAENFIAVVNNPDKAGEAPAILGVYRTSEATIFSWDVAVQKARTALFFSNNQLAMSSRTVGFLAERYFPPGINGNPPGPFFGFQEAVSLKRDAVFHRFPGDPNLPNGITIFPGGFPLYRHGQLVGAIGVSGDGIDQDDIIAAAGTVDFLAADSIRADHYTYHGARLPYAKFPRDPDLQ